MKDFITVAFDPVRCLEELDELGRLLKSRSDLSERGDVQPFFRARHQLTAFIGASLPFIRPANRLAFEFPVFGDFAADIVIGNQDQAAFCLIELEDAKHDSIFTQVRGRSTREWGRRFEHGFSQLVDWFYALDDLKHSQRFAKDFGHGHTQFFGVLVIGRSASLSASERDHLKWRTDRISINTHKIVCLNLDDLYHDLRWWISHYPAATRPE